MESCYAWLSVTAITVQIACEQMILLRNAQETRELHASGIQHAHINWMVDKLLYFSHNLLWCIRSRFIAEIFFFVVDMGQISSRLAFITAMRSY